MTQLVYAGIGSRATPSAILEAMTTMATWLARRGWHLHSRRCRRGADSAFAAGAPAASPHPVPAVARISRLPGARLPHARRRISMRTCLAIAAALHPAWHRCSPAARKLHARNAAILLGQNTDTPVHAVVAWTSRGLPSPEATGMGHPNRATTAAFLC